jgi:TRAP-type C4-dicarboxylate transport system substrate-binding protein
MRNKTLKVLALIMLVAMLGLSLTGCGGGAATNDEPAKTDEEQKVIELTFVTPFPANHHQQVQVIQPFADEVYEKTNGRIKINIHAGGSISSGTQVLDDVLSGAVDMGWTMQGYTPGRCPLTAMFELPVHFRSAEEATNTLWSLLDENKAFQEEYSKFKVLSLFTACVGNAYTSKRPIRGIDDFKGLHLRSASAMVERTLKTFGATAANMPMGDAYDAIDRGIVDGLATDHAAIDTYKLYEVLKYATHGLELYASPQTFIMSLDAWNKLSPDDQKIFEGIIGRQMSLKSAKIYDELYNVGYETMVREGMEIYELADEDKKEFQSHVDEIVKGYIEELGATGLPAQQVYDDMIKYRDSYR